MVVVVLALVLVMLVKQSHRPRACSFSQWPLLCHTMLLMTPRVWLWHTIQCLLVTPKIMAMAYNAMPAFTPRVWLLALGDYAPARSTTVRRETLHTIPGGARSKRNGGARARWGHATAL